MLVSIDTNETISVCLKKNKYVLIEGGSFRRWENSWFRTNYLCFHFLMHRNVMSIFMSIIMMYQVLT